MPETVLACPVCESCKILKSAASNMRRESDRADWWCRQCNGWRNRVIERESRASGPKRSGLSKQLLETSPDAVGGDD